MLSRPALLLVAISALACPCLAASTELDQVSPYTNAWFFTFAGDVWQQQVRAGVDGLLDSLEVAVEGPVGAQVELRLRAGDGWNVGPTRWTALYTKSTAFQERPVFDVRAAGLLLAAGEAFVLEVEGNGTGAEFVGSYRHPLIGPPDYPEPLFLGGPGCYQDCGWRIGVRTWMRGAPSSRPAHPLLPHAYALLPGGTLVPSLFDLRRVLREGRTRRGPAPLQCRASARRRQVLATDVRSLARSRYDPAACSPPSRPASPIRSS
jgi:hypothetical protein